MSHLLKYNLAQNQDCSSYKDYLFTYTLFGMDFLYFNNLILPSFALFKNIFKAIYIDTILNLMNNFFVVFFQIFHYNY